MKRRTRILQPNPEGHRWLVTVTYYREADDEVVQFTVDELEELQDIIESGPNFYAIKAIQIRPDYRLGDGAVTVEQSENL